VRFTYTVEVEVERVEGKFASRDEVAEQLQEALDSADPGSIDGIGADSASNYEVQSWDVQEQAQPKPVRRRPLVRDGGGH
jgi:hypothetical protein